MLVDTIKMCYANKTRFNLSIFGVWQKNLGIYTTQEADVVKGISRIPLALARLSDEDLIDLDKLTLRQSQTFDLPEIEDTDELN